MIFDFADPLVFGGIMFLTIWAVTAVLILATDTGFIWLGVKMALSAAAFMGFIKYVLPYA